MSLYHIREMQRPTVMIEFIPINNWDTSSLYNSSGYDIFILRIFLFVLAFFYIMIFQLIINLLLEQTFFFGENEGKFVGCSATI